MRRLWGVVLPLVRCVGVERLVHLVLPGVARILAAQNRRSPLGTEGYLVSGVLARSRKAVRRSRPEEVRGEDGRVPAQRRTPRNGVVVPRLPVRWPPPRVPHAPSPHRPVACRYFRHLFTNHFVLASVAKTLLAMLRVHSMLEVFVLTVWAKLSPTCPYVAFLRRLYPEDHVLSEEQIRTIKATRMGFMVPLHRLDPARCALQPCARWCRRRQGTSSRIGWCFCGVAPAR
jgi:hypothetical protein